MWDPRSCLVSSDGEAQGIPQQPAVVPALDVEFEWTLTSS